MQSNELKRKTSVWSLQLQKRFNCDYVRYAGWTQSVDVTNKKLKIHAAAAARENFMYLFVYLSQNMKLCSDDERTEKL